MGTVQLAHGAGANGRHDLVHAKATPGCQRGTSSTDQLFRPAS